MKKKFDKKDAYRSLRVNVKSIAELGEPTDDEINAELERLTAKVGSEKKDLFKKLGYAEEDIELEARIEAIEAKLSDQESNIGIFTLSADQALFRNMQNIVLFARLSDGVADALAKLNLSYRDGTFTNTAEGVNILFISYQLRFAADGVVNGYREGLIRQGSTYDHARSQMTAIAGAATHVSGSTVLRLSRNDSFHIRAFHTDASNINLVTASSGTKLTIAKL